MTDIPDYNPVPLETPPAKQGCFIFTLQGCLLTCFGVSLLLCCVLIAVFFIGTSAIIALIASNEVTMSGSESFVLENQQVASLLVNDPKIKVHVVGGEDNQIQVDYVLHEYALSEEEARRLLDNVTVSIERKSDNLFVVLVDNEGSAFFSYYTLDVTLQVPHEMNTITIATQQDILIENVTAEFDLDSEYSSDIVLNDVAGTFDVSALGQSTISFTGMLAPDATHRFTTANGDITLLVRDTPDLAYIARTSAAGYVTCPDLTERAKQCRNSIGTASHLEVTSSGGDITLTIE